MQLLGVVITVSMSNLRNPYHRITIVTAENSTLTVTLTGEWRRRSGLHLTEPIVNVGVYLCWGLVCLCGYILGSLYAHCAMSPISQVPVRTAQVTTDH